MLERKILGITVCVVAVFSTVILASSSMNAPENEPEPVRTQSENEAPVYVLKDYAGKLAVYKFGEEQPNQVLNVFISSLPEFDQQQLHSGVYAYSREQLNGLIQDYDG